MNMKSAVLATADRHQVFARAVTSVGAVYWVTSLQGIWTGLAILFTEGEGMRFALYVNAVFSAISGLQMASRNYLKLTGTNLPRAGEPPHDDGTASDGQ